MDKNGWGSLKIYILQDGVIYEAYLRIAKAKDGRNILYAVNLNINNGIAVDQGATQKRAAILSAMPSSYSISNMPTNVNRKLEERLSGDDLLNAQDLIEEIQSVGGTVDYNGYVTVYHRTTENAKEKILSEGKMTAKEDGIFFSTKPDGKIKKG